MNTSTAQLTTVSSSRYVITNVRNICKLHDSHTARNLASMSYFSTPGETGEQMLARHARMTNICKRLNARSQSRPSKLYHMVTINSRTKAIIQLTKDAMTFQQCSIMKTRFAPALTRSIELVEATSKTQH